MEPKSPQNSTERAATALEWPRFLELASGEALTEGGRSRILALADSSRWARDVENAKHLQSETGEALLLLEREGLWGPLQGLPDPVPLLDRLSRGAVLETAELVVIRRWSQAIESWRLIPREELPNELFGHLFDQMLSSIPDISKPLRRLDHVLTPEGELSERASPKLAQLYAEIRALKREIGATLDHVMRNLADRGVLQETFSDVRDGRYVLPVRISAQGEVDGIIYEASASRQTVFIEPREVAQLNNRLRSLQNELIQEIFRVLTEIAGELRPYTDSLRAGTGALLHWDAVQARARFSRRYSGHPIEVTAERVFRIERTAHPLLWWLLAPGDIVRNSIHFGAPAQALLLTGPNTGGKTVLLKTLGLAAICARAGFPFPSGSEPPVVPFFTALFADLGDPQSIEQHLSSFSGHVMRFKEILSEVSDRALVLLDELNSATDPEEGAALGRAFLETVLARGALVVTTTHDPNLKALATENPKIQSASMQFDEASRTPTYRIVIGVPGRSRALETAERLGIPQDVISLARSYLSKGHVELEAMLKRLEEDARATSQAREEAERLRREAEKIENEWRSRTERQVDDMLDRTRQKLRRVLETAQEDVRATVRKLEDARTRKDVDSVRSHLSDTAQTAQELMDSALREEAPEVAEEIARRKSPPPKPAATDQVVVGAQVRVPKWKSVGTVLERQGDRVKVALGKISMSLTLAEVELVAPPKAAPARAQVTASAVAPDFELDLRGQRFDEGMARLGAWLDQHYRSGEYVEVRVIHGFGTGALREGTRKLLGSLPYVRSFRDGAPNEGGAGATVIELARSKV